MLGLHHGSVVSADTLVELLWGEDPPRTAAKALQTHISSLRRALGDGFVLTQGTGWALAESEVDASRYKSAARLGRDAAATGDISQAVARFEEALALWRGIPNCPTVGEEHPRRHDGSRATPRSQRIELTHCSRRPAPRRSSVSSRRRWPRRHCAKGDGGSSCSPSTAPAGKVTLLPLINGHGQCSPTSWESIPGRSFDDLRPPSSHKTPHWMLL
jgi:hypothetical protein